MNKPLLLACALFGATSAGAQVRLSAGPQVGYTLATSTYELFAYADYNTHSRSGFAGGLTGELGVDHWFLRSALLYTQKGYNQEETRPSNFTTSSISRTRTDYLALPLNVGYTQQRDGQGLQLFAGPYAGLMLGGRYTREFISGGTSTVYSGRMVAEGNDSRRSDAPLRTFDFGLQGGIGYRYQHLLAQLEYSRGLHNVDPSDPSLVSFYGSSAYRNRAFQLSLAYLFGPKS